MSMPNRPARFCPADLPAEAVAESPSKPQFATRCNCALGGLPRELEEPPSVPAGRSPSSRPGYVAASGARSPGPVAAPDSPAGGRVARVSGIFPRPGGRRSRQRSPGLLQKYHGRALIFGI